MKDNIKTSEILYPSHIRQTAGYIKVIWALPQKDMVLGLYEFKAIEKFMRKNKIGTYQIIGINVPEVPEYRSKKNYTIEVTYDKSITNKHERNAKHS